MFGSDWDDCTWCGGCLRCGDHKSCREKLKINDEYLEVKKATEELEKLSLEERVNKLLAAKAKVDRLIWSQDAALRIAHWKAKYASYGKSYYDEAVKRLQTGEKIAGINVSTGSANPSAVLTEDGDKRVINE